MFFEKGKNKGKEEGRGLLNGAKISLKKNSEAQPLYTGSIQENPLISRKRRTKVQEVRKTRKSKTYIPMNTTISIQHQICHPCIPTTCNIKQNRIRYLECFIPTPHIMPKLILNPSPTSNLTNFEIPPLPYMFPKS
jgi:hypothetical protein